MSQHLLLYLSVDCVWGDWQSGECSADCGGGVQPMMRIKTVHAQFGGAECDGEKYGEQACNEQPCPGMPLMIFKWDSNIFGVVHRKALFKTTSHNFSISVDCTWNEWEHGECSVTCAGGTRVDTRTIATEAMHGGFCDPEGGLRVEPCNPEACPRMLYFYRRWVL